MLSARMDIKAVQLVTNVIMPGLAIPSAKPAIAPPMALGARIVRQKLVNVLVGIISMDKHVTNVRMVILTTPIAPVVAAIKEE